MCPENTESMYVSSKFDEIASIIGMLNMLVVASTSLIQDVVVCDQLIWM